MAVFTLPATRDLLKYHTRWNDQALTPYIDDLLDLWAENDVHGVLDVCMQGPMLTRFGIVPDDMKSASRIMKLEPLYRYIFLRKDIKVYRSEGRVYIDVPWQRDPVWLGDLLTSREFISYLWGREKRLFLPGASYRDWNEYLPRMRDPRTD